LTDINKNLAKEKKKNSQKGLSHEMDLALMTCLGLDAPMIL
jgi:hypothetical protein